MALPKWLISWGDMVGLRDACGGNMCVCVNATMRDLDICTIVDGLEALYWVGNQSYARWVCR